MPHHIALICFSDVELEQCSSIPKSTPTKTSMGLEIESGMIWSTKIWNSRIDIDLDHLLLLEEDGVLVILC